MRYGPIPGDSSVYFPAEFVVALAASDIPACTSTSTTVSPAEGLPLVLLVTVPVKDAALAKATDVRDVKTRETKENRGDLIVLDSYARFELNLTNDKEVTVSAPIPTTSRQDGIVINPPAPSP
jgi:hypothetical protein